MTEPFIPFDLANSSLPRATNPAANLKVMPKPELTPAFTTLSELTPVHAQAPVSTPPAPRVPEPTITVQRDGDRVTGIRVACSCGQVIEMVCAY